jgi:hypothetical protein
MFYCPSTTDECTDAVMKLLPRGRAWSTNEGLPERAAEISFNPDAFNPDVFAAVEAEGSTIWRYFRAFAEPLFYFYQRVCDLRREFWCHSIVETRDDWMTEYGLPDECDPFPDLCTKVSAIGGTRCEYYAEVAARAGWTITCEETFRFCGSRMGCSRMGGRFRVGRTLGRAEIRIVVFLAESPAYQPIRRFLPSLMGRMRMGRRFSCGPSLLPLECLMSRVIHAEILTVYEVR